VYLGLSFRRSQSKNSNNENQKILIIKKKSKKTKLQRGKNQRPIPPGPHRPLFPGTGTAARFWGAGVSFRPDGACPGRGRTSEAVPRAGTELNFTEPWPGPAETTPRVFPNYFFVRGEKKRKTKNII